MDKQKVTKGLLKIVLGLSIIFAVLAFVYDQKQSQQQQTTHNQYNKCKRNNGQHKNNSKIKKHWLLIPFIKSGR
ncbi:hypothetical protein EFL35_05460 [Weissella paramesenteroides]|nr:hypothetical protein [Weissella paramesenteroides]MCS9999174.1 hypothetical protein [Weissella paramesenteroides]MCT0259649.1 hypothetical protein [Weissella paramesenteroides]